MAAGLEFFNANGESIIDTSFPNYGLIAKYKMSELPRGRPAQTNAPGSITWPYLSLTGRFAPVLFFAGLGNQGQAHAGINTVEVNGTSFKFFFESNNYIAGNIDSTIYVFDLMNTVYPNGAAHGVGFESFDAAGKLIFTTALKPLKFVHLSKVANTGYDSSEGGFCAYGGLAGNANSTGTNGHASGGAYADTWVVDNVPANVTIAASMTRFRYGASGSSTESDYGDAYFECVTVDNRVNPSKVYAQPIMTTISGEGFGGFYGTAMDYTAGYQPYVQLIDVTGY